MGSCQCRPVCPCPTKYDLRKRHEKVDPHGAQVSPRTPVEKFDSLRNGNVTPWSIQQVSLRGLEEEKEKSAEGDIDSSEESEQDTIDITTEEKSRDGNQSDKDSDLGSECLSIAQSSGRSKTKGQVVPLTDSATEGIQSDEDGDSLASEELDLFDCSQTSGFFGTISERPFLGSRLGKRQTSHTSQDSREILYWKKGNRLGRGSFGTVWLGMMPTGELIAVKQIELIETNEKEVETEYAKIYQEVSLLKEFRHKNIVGYYGSSYEKVESQHVISVFMQYVPGGTMSSIIQKFGALEEPITAIYSRQLMDAVAYLHSNNIVHRDIKSANILLMAEGIIKLIDFGCAKRLAMRMSCSGSHLQQSLKGTPYWMAPEVINETGHGKKSDVWGDRPPLAAIYAIGSDEYPVPLLPDTFSDQAKEFVQLCLIRDKHKRPPALRLLTHPYVKRPSSCTSNSSNRWGHRRHDVN